MTKTCRYCNQDRPEVEFPTAGIVNGKHYRRWKCNSCYLMMKKEYKGRQKEGYLAYKKTLKCERCGFDDYRALQFHHAKGDKEFNVAEGHGKCSLDRIMKEIEKCQVLCANCHQIEHFSE